MKIIIFFFLMILGPSAFSQSRLENYCHKIGGQVHKEYTCPKSKLKLKWDFCITQDNQGRELFFDGCTGPSGGHADLLYPACIKHDFCYHHEPTTHGYNQRDCDRQFLDESLSLCQAANDPDNCRAWARAMYTALRGFGKIAFHCADYEASY